MDMVSTDRIPAAVAARLARAEVLACCKIIERATPTDGPLVATWSRATILNVPHAMTASPRLALMVKDAWADADAFAAVLGGTDAGTPALAERRQAALRSVRRLIAAIEDAGDLPMSPPPVARPEVAALAC